jgi:glutamate racemase
MKRILIFCAFLLLFQCSDEFPLLKNHNVFMENVLSNESGFFYLDTAESRDKKILPIGIFDSGIGGLSVFDAIINADNFNDENREIIDGIKDFSNENFVYLADQANMPYSNYAEAGKKDLLEEHILKDAIFLLNDRYHLSSSTPEIQNTKPAVKTIVIACNTATAYGKQHIEEMLKMANIDMKVIGVVGAGAKGALDIFDQDESGVIAIFATPATVHSNAYVRTLHDQIESGSFSGNIQIYQQGGKGLHESIDNKPSYIDTEETHPYRSYQGPSCSNESYIIEKPLLQTYNFDSIDGRLLYNGKRVKDSDSIQLNSIENYVRYHIVSLVEKIRISEVKLPLKAIVLGCTHYPYVEKEIEEILAELRDLEAYREILSAKITLIDPAENTAIELYKHLSENDLLNSSAKNTNSGSSFFISVPNIFEPSVETTSQGAFTYDYQYVSRGINELKDFTLIVPFSPDVISGNQLHQIESNFPATYDRIKQ